MQTRTLGRSGLVVSVIGLGCNNFGGMIGSLDAAASAKIIHTALDAGITLLDTADSYGADGGSEVILGDAVRGRRHDVVLATKFASPMNRAKSARYDGSRRYIMNAVEESLRRLKTDYIDLYQYHFMDEQTPIEETLRALEDLVRQGKVRYIGCSNLPAWRLVDAHWTARQGGLSEFLSTQTEYNLLERIAEQKLFPALDRIGMSLLPYFPLASGLLSGKYRQGQAAPTGTRLDLPYFKSGMTEERLQRVEALARFAEERGRTLLELALGWLLSHSVVSSIIAGATRPEQVTSNVAAVGWVLSPDDLAALDRVAQSIKGTECISSSA